MSVSSPTFGGEGETLPGHESTPELSANLAGRQTGEIGLAKRQVIDGEIRRTGFVREPATYHIGEVIMTVLEQSSV